MNNKSRMVGIISLITMIISAGPLRAGYYTIKDLEVLEQNRNAKEYLEHAHDIRPSERNDHWKKMTQHMAVVFTSKMIEGRLFNRENFQFIEKINLWPTLTEDEFFQIKREGFHSGYFTQCLKKNEDTVCKLELLTAWASSRKDPDKAVEYLGMFKNLDKKEEALFLSRVLNSNISAFLCKKPVILDLTVKRLINQAALETDAVKFKTWNEEFMNQDCWNQIRPVFDESLMGSSSYHREQSFKVLEARGDLIDIEKSVFLISYILDEPKVGRLFNLAWNELKQIGKNNNYRRRVLARMKNMDPLPGRLFHLIDENKKSILLTQLDRNFPEYLDHYSRTCLDYLEGKKEFPRGNPTPNCQKIFADKVVSPVINQGLKLRYSAIKK
ncbi:MAG: hypothetical protein EP319_07030 [Deltaproteobacteria bacterium]|nr:MAG: hypothetical protein EP319_07030 [Deltaproteobacteria bacterium]